MSKLRSVNTQFWSDPWVEDLTPSEKLLYLYFITNEKTNMLGVYELSIKKISFETGIDSKTVRKALEGFEKIGKVKYTKNYIILLNFAKHQNYNTNMKKSAIDVYNNLPKELKNNDKDIDKSNPSKGFEMVVKCLGMVRKVELEVEYESEIEDEEEKPLTPKGESFDFDTYLEKLNELFGRQFKVINQSVKRKMNGTLKEYTKDNVWIAMKNCKNDPHHIEHDYKYCTPEFFARKSTLERHGDKLRNKSGNKTYQLID